MHAHPVVMNIGVEGGCLCRCLEVGVVKCLGLKPFVGVGEGCEVGDLVVHGVSCRGCNIMLQERWNLCIGHPLTSTTM